jgi:PAS domain S-box-containing protein
METQLMTESPFEQKLVKTPAEPQWVDKHYSLESAPKSIPIKLLLVEDDPVFAHLVQEILAEARDKNFIIEWVPNLSQGLQRLYQGKIDLVLLDLGLPDSQGLDTFVQAYAHFQSIPFIVLTGLDDEPLAHTALRQGAQDYLVKGQVNASMLLRAILYATERKQEQKAAAAEREKLFAVLDNLPAFVYLRGADFKISFANRRFLEDFGEPGDKPCYEVLRRKSEPCEDCPLLEVLKTKVPYRFEWTTAVNNRTYEVYNYPFCSDDGSQLVLTLGLDITERKQAEAALEESEKKYRTIVETAQEGIWVIDAAAKTIFVNQRLADKLGCSITEMLGRPVSDFIEDEDLSEFEQYLWRLSRGLPQIGDRRFRLPDGSNLWTITSAQPLFDESSRYVGAFAMLTDITARKEAEEAVRKSSDRLRALIQTSPAAIVALDVEGKVTLWNPAAKQIFGWSEEEALGRNYSHLVNPKEHRADFETLLGRTLQGESSFGLEFLRQRKDGAQIYINSSAAPLHDARGNVMGVMAVMLDITQHKRAEAALLASEKRFKQLVENSPFPLVLVDAKNDIEYLNPKFLQILGYNSKDLPNLRVWTNLAYPDRVYRKNVMEAWGSALKKATQEGTEIEPVEFQVTCKDGTVRIMEISGAPISEGKYFAIFKDLTERKQAEEKLRVSEQNLRYLTSQLFTTQERERKRIAYELHDELGQSLMTLKLMAGSIEKGKSLKQIKDTCRQMRAYLNEAVENVRLLSRELSPRNLENFGLVIALNRLINDFAKLHHLEQLHAEIDEINDLFSMEAQLNLYRIIQECLTNIAKHAQATQLSLIVKRHEESVTFQVEDNGKGFGIGQVLSSETSKGGIGLASMDERARMLGGSLEIRSQEGQGTLISFTIPITSDT